MQPGDALIGAVGADEQGERIVRCVRRLAGVTGLRPLFVHVIETDVPDPLDVWEARSLLRRAGARAVEMRVETGNPGTEMVAVARAERAAVAVAAVRGAQDPGETPQGGVAGALVADGDLAVVLLRPDVEPCSAAEAAVVILGGDDAPDGLDPSEIVAMPVTAGGRVQA